MIPKTLDKAFFLSETATLRSEEWCVIFECYVCVRCTGLRVAMLAPVLRRAPVLSSEARDS